MKIANSMEALLLKFRGKKPPKLNIVTPSCWRRAIRNNVFNSEFFDPYSSSLGSILLVSWEGGKSKIKQSIKKSINK